MEVKILLEEVATWKPGEELEGCWKYIQGPESVEVTSLTRANSTTSGSWQQGPQNTGSSIGDGKTTSVVGYFGGGCCLEREVLTQVSVAGGVLDSDVI